MCLARCPRTGFFAVYGKHIVKGASSLALPAKESFALATDIDAIHDGEALPIPA